MTTIVIIFGTLILLSGLVILVNPEIVFRTLRKHSERIELQILAVVVRLALGVLLIYVSGISRFPLVVAIIGWLSVIAAVALAAIGRNSFKRLIAWALSLQRPYGRVGGILAACFGGFLIYAFV